MLVHHTGSRWCRPDDYYIIDEKHVQGQRAKAGCEITAVSWDGVIVDASTGYDEEHFSTVIKTVRDLLDNSTSVEID